MAENKWVIGDITPIKWSHNPLYNWLGAHFEIIFPHQKGGYNSS